MRNNSALEERALLTIELMRRYIIDPSFWSRHRRRAEDFIREHVLTFPVLMLLLMQKSLKSLQNHLHEFLQQLFKGNDVPRVSGGAVTHARAKLRSSAFVELNTNVILKSVYGTKHTDLVKRWQGHRLLAVDSSLMRLPTSAAVGEAFGWVQCANHRGPQERYPQGRISVLYDLLNQLALEAKLVGSKTAETQMAQDHLRAVEPGDVVVTDRGYTGYQWLVMLLAAQAHFISRCSKGSFSAAQQLFARNQAEQSLIVTLEAPRDLREECQKNGWPLQLKVRFVTVRLKTGELEVLVTSLLDEDKYPTEIFGAAYWSRWGVETYYGKLKGSLDLEHCSGKTVEAVEQDFHATVLLSNLESVLTEPAQVELYQRTMDRQQPAQINRSVAVHAMKSRLIDLLTSRLPAQQVLSELTRWFQANPISKRTREVPRRTQSPSRSYHHRRRVRKVVF